MINSDFLNNLDAPEKSIEKAMKKLKKKNWKKKINFRLKDWGVSRQRYWGCPIPIAYDKNGKLHTYQKMNCLLNFHQKINLKYKRQSFGLSK